MVATREQFPKLTPEEYFTWEAGQSLRHEYIGGEVYAMSGGTIPHSEIAGNLLAIFKQRLRGSGCKTLNSDARVNIQGTKDYVYPDVSVTCDQRDRSATQFITYPCLIVEVLSLTTEAYDSPEGTLRVRGQKFSLYRRNASLRDYVLVSAEAIAIDLYHKNDDGRWDILDYRAGDIVEFRSVAVQVAIEEIYENIVFGAGADG
jgi:Uma2 family endonuclease